MGTALAFVTDTGFTPTWAYMLEYQLQIHFEGCECLHLFQFIQEIGNEAMSEIVGMLRIPARNSFLVSMIAIL